MPVEPANDESCLDESRLVDSTTSKPQFFEYVPNPWTLLRKPTPEKIKLLDEFARRLKADDKEITAKAFQNGVELLDWRKEFRRGEVESWLKDIVRMPHRNAQQRMQIAKAFPREKHESLSHLTLTCLVKLSGKGEDIAKLREDILSEVDSGQQIGFVEIEARVKYVKEQRVDSDVNKALVDAVDAKIEKATKMIVAAVGDDTESLCGLLEDSDPMRLGRKLLEHFCPQVNNRTSQSSSRNHVEQPNRSSRRRSTRH